MHVSVIVAAKALLIGLVCWRRAEEVFGAPTIAGAADQCPSR